MARARPEPPRPWTVEEFLDWERAQPEKYEYLGGVIRMMVGGTSDHYTIVGNIFAILRARVRGGPCRAYLEGMKVDIGSGIAYPDVVVTCSEVGPKADEVPEPVIIVEVLSASTESFDRGAKWLGYQTLPSLRQYVLVSQEEQQVEVFERERGGWAYRVLKGKDATLRSRSAAPRSPWPRSTRTPRSIGRGPPPADPIRGVQSWHPPASGATIRTPRADRQGACSAATKRSTT